MLPSPEPTYLVDETVSTDVYFGDLGFEITVPGTTLSLWNSRDIFSKTRSPKEEIAVFIDVTDKRGNMENLGCCFLTSEANDNTKMEKEF